MNYLYTLMESPIGLLKIVASWKGLVAILWESDSPQRADIGQARRSEELILVRAKTQLQEYFEWKRTSFDLPLDVRGSEFQKDVWDALLNIPYGKTVSYQHIAKEVGKPQASRAVGTANSKNLLAIIIPCHRVISANGKLSGCGRGREARAFLIDHEAKCLR